jgi:hypothetical protein
MGRDDSADARRDPAPRSPRAVPSPRTSDPGRAGPPGGPAPGDRSFIADLVAGHGDLGCDVVQGYHLARPMQAAAFTTWLSQRAANGVPHPGAEDPVVGAGAQANRPTV